MVHHDKLKPYYARVPLDNSWVFHMPPSEDMPPTAADTTTGPLNLWDIPSDTEEAAVEATRDNLSLSPASLNDDQLPDVFVQPYLEEADTTHFTRTTALCSHADSTSLQRPQRVCRARNQLGDWLEH